MTTFLFVFKKCLNLASLEQLKKDSLSQNSFVAKCDRLIRLKNVSKNFLPTLFLPFYIVGLNSFWT